MGGHSVRRGATDSVINARRLADGQVRNCSGDGNHQEIASVASAMGLSRFPRLIPNVWLLGYSIVEFHNSGVGRTRG